MGFIHIDLSPTRDILTLSSLREWEQSDIPCQEPVYKQLAGSRGTMPRPGFATLVLALLVALGDLIAKQCSSCLFPISPLQACWLQPPLAFRPSQPPVLALPDAML